MGYDPHKKYKKVGECRRCGRCCDQHCPYFRWVSLKDIKQGEVFESGMDSGYIVALCEIFDLPITKDACSLEVRKGFPYDPWQTPPKCGYSWIEAK